MYGVRPYPKLQTITLNPKPSTPNPQLHASKLFPFNDVESVARAWADRFVCDMLAPRGLQAGTPSRLLVQPHGSLNSALALQ